MSSISRAAILLEIQRHVASRRIFFGFASFLAVVAWASFNTGSPAGYSDGVMLGTMLWLSFNASADRSANFGLCMRNHITPKQSFNTKLAAAMILLCVFMLVVWLSLAVLVLDPMAALWHSINAFLFVSLIFGLSLLVETVVNFSAPGFLAAFLLGSTLLLFVARGQDGMEAMARMGLQTQPGSYSSLARLLVFSILLNATSITTSFAIWSFRHRRKPVISAHEHQRT